MDTNTPAGHFFFYFSIGQRVRCTSGEIGIVRHRWSDGIEAFYGVEFDTDPKYAEICEAYLRLPRTSLCTWGIRSKSWVEASASSPSQIRSTLQIRKLTPYTGPC